MKEFLETYKIRINTLSPVFIGSGESITKKEYIFDRMNNKYYIFDSMKLTKGLSKRGLLNAYLDYLCNSSENLSSWFQINNIKKNDYLKYVKYELNAKDIDTELRGKNSVSNKELICFVKNAYGLPYIPGSSLKGAIRTALLANDIMKNQNKYSAQREKVMYSIDSMKAFNKRVLQREMKEIEMVSFNTLNRSDDRKNAVNDIMTGIRISDSKPLVLDDIVLCQKVDLTLDGRSNKLPILRECIRPNTNIEFDLTIDTSLTTITAVDILKAIEEFTIKCQNSFYSKFNLKNNFEKRTLFLGGGCGFQSKTILSSLLRPADALNVTAKIMNASFRNHKHNRDVEKGISPHIRKCTYYQGELVDMGLCNFKIFKSNK